MSSLTLKEIITQVWGKCKSTFPIINDTTKSNKNVYSSNKTEEIIRNIPVYTLSDIESSSTANVNLLEYFLGENYNDIENFTSKKFIIITDKVKSFYLGDIKKVTVFLGSVKDIDFLCIDKIQSKWIVYNVKLINGMNYAQTKAGSNIMMDCYKQGDDGNFTKLTSERCISSINGLMDDDYIPTQDQTLVTLKYLNTSLEEVKSLISSKITEELNKINNAEDNTY